MATARDDPSSGSGSSGGSSHLPYNQVPVFKTGETDLNEWTRKVEFLAQLWPPEQLHYLAPRIAMQCEGSAFQRVSRVDPKVLRSNSTDGVQAIVEALGGIWGKSRLEDKFERFERAIYSTVLMGDETNESYLARHDHQFEELKSMKVGLDEFRAYILLRNSSLSSDDKKRLIVESQGSLDYREVVSNLKLLGSKFFHEVHAGKAQNVRTKTYDSSTFYADEEPAMFMSTPATAGDEEPTFFGDPLDDGHLEQWAEEGDADAVVCLQFEESLLDTLQSDPDMAACMNTYMEARKRLSDKANFWNPPRKGMGKGRKGKSDRFEFRPRKPLAQRVLESNCRRCGAKGKRPLEGRVSAPQPKCILRTQCCQRWCFHWNGLAGVRLR